LSEYQLTSREPLSGYVQQIKIRKIRPSSRPLRGDLDPLEGLMASIMESGLLEPIVVRPIDGGYEVVAGNRRLEACRRLKFNAMPCHIVELDDREAYEVSLSENIQRNTLNPVEEAKAFKQYVDDLGYGSASELARKIGKSPSYISRRIALLKLPKKIQEGLLLRGAKLWMAQELLPLDNDQHTTEVLADFITDSKIDSREKVRRLVRHLKDNEGRQANGSAPPQVSYEQREELKAHIIDRTLARCVASLRQNMDRFDDEMGALDEKDSNSWIVKESLIWHRRLLNTQVDELLRLRKRFRLAYR